MRNHTSHDGACGAPVARKRARRVREAARGNPPVETPAGRPGSTSRRTAEGKNPREIRRCLKRYIARQLYRTLATAMTPAAETS